MKSIIAIAFSLVSLISHAGIDEGLSAYSEGDYATALKEWSSPEAQSDANVQVHLGFMHEYGMGVEENDVTAVEWYRKAAEQGDAAGLNNLATMYDDGTGVEKDAEEALKLFQRSAELGSRVAMYNLGHKYYSGSGTEADSAQALNWFRQAAELWEPSALYMLGKMYNEGDTVNKNPVIAYALMLQAAANGEENGQLAVEEIGESMKKKDIEAAKKLAMKMDEAEQVLSVIDAYASSKAAKKPGKRK